MGKQIKRATNALVPCCGNSTVRNMLLNPTPVTPTGDDNELRDDGGNELRDDGGLELED